MVAAVGRTKATENRLNPGTGHLFRYAFGMLYVRREVLELRLHSCINFIFCVVFAFGSRGLLCGQGGRAELGDFCLRPAWVTTKPCVDLLKHSRELDVLDPRKRTRVTRETHTAMQWTLSSIRNAIVVGIARAKRTHMTHRHTPLAGGERHLGPVLRVPLALLPPPLLVV